MLVSRLARENVTVALSADGGDELFAGYLKHFQHFNFYLWFSRFPRIFSYILSPLKYLPRFSHRQELFNSNCTNQVLKSKLETIVLNDNEIKMLLTYKYDYPKTNFDNFNLLNDSNDFLNKLLAIDYVTYLENDILTKVDKSTMSASLEGREPFLDHRVLEFVSSLPSTFKFDGKTSKKILKDLHKRYINPKLMHNKKMGFGGPVKDWLKAELKSEMLRMISSPDFPIELLNNLYVKEMYTNFLTGSKSIWWYKIYQIFIFLKWYEFWIIKKTPTKYFI